MGSEVETDPVSDPTFVKQPVEREGGTVVMEHVYRCYAEKRAGFDVEAEKVWRELREQLGIANLEGVRII